jgi:sugar transferase EpsL
MRSRSWYPATKRALDLLVAVVALVPVALVLSVAALAGLALQGRPVLFAQRRVGRDGRPFRMLKLRTMTGTPAAGRAYLEQHRLTGYGRVLRRLRLDELPQVFNLLTGAMSLVGPRPLLAEHLVAAGGGGRRHQVRPGLTCFAQVELAERGYLDRYRQIALDEAYVDRAGPRTDLAILWRTAAALLGRRRPAAAGLAGDGLPEAAPGGKPGDAELLA